MESSLSARLEAWAGLAPAEAGKSILAALTDPSSGVTESGLASVISELLRQVNVSELDAGRFAEAFAGHLATPFDSKSALVLKALRKATEARHSKGLGRFVGFAAFLIFVYTALSENENERIQRERSEESARER